jgi:hypothetical protein
MTAIEKKTGRDDCILIFSWPRAHDLHLLLPAMIGLALVLHLGALLLFHLIYPDPNPESVPQGRVLVPTTATPGWSTARFWVEAADPSIFAPTRAEESLPALVETVTFEPSFMAGTMQPQFPGTPDFSPPAVSMASPPFPVAYLHHQTPVAAPASQTTPTVRILEQGAPAAFTPHESLVFPEFRPIPGSPSLFLAGIGSDGLVFHVFLQQASGSPAWDDWAAAWLRGGRFAPSDEELRWSWISIMPDYVEAKESLPVDEPPVLP